MRPQAAPGLEPLIEALASPDPATRAEVRAILRSLTGQDFGEDRGRWRSWWERHRHVPVREERPRVQEPPGPVPDRNAAERARLGLPPIFYEKYKARYDLQWLFAPPPAAPGASLVPLLVGPMVLLAVMAVILLRLYSLGVLPRLLDLLGR